MQTSNIVIADVGLRRLFRTDIDRATAGHFLNIAGYEACRIAYTECEEWLEELLAVIWDNYQFMKSFVAERMPEVRVFPLEGTYLAWLDFSAYGFSVEEIESRNVQKAEVVLDEGYIFGAGGACHERVNLACPRWVLEQSMERLAAAYA